MVIGILLYIYLIYVTFGVAELGAMSRRSNKKKEVIDHLANVRRISFYKFEHPYVVVLSKTRRADAWKSAERYRFNFKGMFIKFIFINR